jgi:hypothetical protein
METPHFQKNVDVILLTRVNIFFILFFYIYCSIILFYFFYFIFLLFDHYAEFTKQNMDD